MKVSVWVHADREGWTTMIYGQRRGAFDPQSLAVGGVRRPEHDVREAKFVAQERFGELWAIDETFSPVQDGALASRRNA